MRNPAWRPAQTHSKRLAGISHHFLGHAKEAPEAMASGVVNSLPILVASGPLHPVDALQPDALVEALGRQLNESPSEGQEAAGRWDIYVEPRPTAIDTGGARLILVLAPASQPGIRSAYRLIKQLPRYPVPRVGVLLSGPGDVLAVDRYQSRLALGASQFLDLSLVDLGRFPVPGKESSVALAGLAERVQEIWSSHGAAPASQEDTAWP